METVLHQCLPCSLPLWLISLDKYWPFLLQLAQKHEKCLLHFPQLCDLFYLSGLYKTFPDSGFTLAINHFFSMYPSHHQQAGWEHAVMFPAQLFDTKNDSIFTLVLHRSTKLSRFLPPPSICLFSMSLPRSSFEEANRVFSIIPIHLK